MLGSMIWLGLSDWVMQGKSMKVETSRNQLFQNVDQVVVSLHSCVSPRDLWVPTASSNFDIQGKYGYKSMVVRGLHDTEAAM